MKKEEKESHLENRNKKDQAFQKSRNKQEERDQLVMPVDDLPLEEIKYESEEERNKKETKRRSSSDKDDRKQNY